MIPSSPSLLGEQLRAARALFGEALRAQLVASPRADVLGPQLLALASTPSQEGLHAWASDFLMAMPKGRQLERDALDLIACAASLELELAGKLAAAVLELGIELVHQQRLSGREFHDDSAKLGPTPTVEGLRTLLLTWINCEVARSGPLLGGMRDLRDRLEATR